MSHDEHASHEEQPQVFALSRKGSSWSLSRRGFLAGATGAAALAAGCGGDETKSGTDVGGGAATGELVDAGPGNAFAAAAPQAAQPAPPSGPQDSCLGMAHSLDVRKIALSQDGKFLASAGGDSRVKIWTIPDGALVHSLSASTSTPRGLAINNDGSRVLIASTASRVQYWDLSQRSPSSRTFRVDTGARCFAFIGGTDLVAVGNTRGEVILYSVPSGLQKGTFKFDQRTYVERLLSSWDGRWVAATAANRTIRFWSIPDGKTRVELTAPAGKSLTAFDLSRDLQTSLAGHSDSSISVWSGAAADPKSSFATRGGLINALRITTDGQRIISFDSQRNCRTSSPTGTELSRFTVTDSSRITEAEITPDGKYLIVAYGKSISVHAIEKKSRDKCLMDVAASSSTTKGITFQAKDSYGHTITYTLPCGSPIPAGAVCTCNCVPGSVRTTFGSTTYRPSTYRPSTSRPTYRPSTYRPTYRPPTYRPPTYSPRTYTTRYWYPN